MVSTFLARHGMCQGLDDVITATGVPEVGAADITIAFFDDASV